MDQIKRARTLRNEASRLFSDMRRNYPESRSLLVTGCSGKEGSTTLSFALAIAASRIENAKVLIVDANFFKPTASSLMKAAKKPGLRNIMDAPENYADYLVEFQENIQVLPAGQGKTEMIDLMRSGALQALQNSARFVFDFVIWDTRAINISASTKILLSVVPHVLLVTESDRTRMDHFSSSLHEIEGLKAQLIAILRNRAGRRAFSAGADQQ